MAIHKNLIFVKIHAPPSVLDKYGPTLKVSRHFKANHLECINPKGLFNKILRSFNFSESHEKEWVRLVREQYPRPKSYSTLERSMIVYKILLKVRFGDHENYVGLKKLLNKRIFLDAFPLHDGPFFSVPKQEPFQYNARQILNYNWAGIRNLLKRQPLNLIHEYFGDRVAFFFAFYGFYTFFLIIPAIIGGVAIIPEIFNKTVEMNYTHTETVGMKVEIEEQQICPRCRHFDVCPFLPFPFYVNAIKYNNIFDKESIDMIPVYVAIWGTLFMIFWRRTEYYWMWMWECDPWISKTSVRVQYNLNNNEKPLGYKIVKFMITILLCVIAACAYCCVFIGLALGLMILQNYALRKFVPIYGFDLGHYKALMIFYAVNVIIMIFLEKVWSIISYTLNKFLNHKYESSYDKSLVATLFGLTIPTTCVLFIYIGFFKARIFTHYEDRTMYDTLGGILMTQCNPVGCSDELALSLCVTVILKELIVKILWHCYYFITLRTDYNQGILLNMDVPCWEREYRLPTVKDDLIHDKMKSLAVQFVLTIAFICGCPFTPIFAIIINIMDIRNTARRLVKGFRRPLLMGNLGIGSWKYMFDVLIIFAFLINTLIVVITTSKFRFNLNHLAYKRRMPFYIFQDEGTLPQYINDEIEVLENKGYQYLSYNSCFYTAGYILLPRSMEEDRHPTPNLALLSYRTYLGSEYYTTMLVLTIFLITFLYFLIPSRLRDVEETRAREKDIINQSRYLRGHP